MMSTPLASSMEQAIELIPAGAHASLEGTTRLER